MGAVKHPAAAKENMEKECGKEEHEREHDDVVVRVDEVDIQNHAARMRILRSGGQEVTAVNDDFTAISASPA